MKNIFKYLLTGILAFTTMLTALDNAGNIVSIFEEGVLNANGEIAYCININTRFQSGYKTRYNATEKLSNDQIADVALSGNCNSLLDR